MLQIFEVNYHFRVENFATSFALGENQDSLWQHETRAENQLCWHDVVERTLILEPEDIVSATQLCVLGQMVLYLRILDFSPFHQRNLDQRNKTQTEFYILTEMLQHHPWRRKRRSSNSVSISPTLALLQLFTTICFTSCGSAKDFDWERFCLGKVLTAKKV